MTSRMSKSADGRERACDGSLAACPLQALKDAGRTAASVMWSPAWADLCQGPKRGRLKTCGPLRWRQTSCVYPQCSFVSMNSPMTTWSWGVLTGFGWLEALFSYDPWPLQNASSQATISWFSVGVYWVSHRQALVHTCSWEALGQFSALRVSRRGEAWRLRRPHQLIIWYILHGRFTAVTSVLVILVHNWIDLISDQFASLSPAGCHLYLDAFMLGGKKQNKLFGFCT